MGLIDAMLPLNLLARPIMQQNYYISLRGDTPAGATNPLGSGTYDDPWDGSTQPWFDWAMGKVPENSTVFLGSTWVEDPVTHAVTNQPFQTKGYPGGFAVKSGQRIVGAGVSSTTVQLVGHTGSGAAQNYVFGNDPTAGFLFLGCEISDMLLDANLPSSAGGTLCAAGGVSLTGKNVMIQRVRVQNFGTNVASVIAFAISGALADTGNPASPSNAVIQECIVDAPSAGRMAAGARVVGINLGNTSNLGSSSGHQMCVIRNCFVDGSPYTGVGLRGIMATGGNGTIVERNRVLNCNYGLFYDELISSPVAPDVISKTTDLIVRDNYFRNVLVGIYLRRDNSPATNPIARIIALQNQFEIQNTSGSYGIQLDVGTDSITPVAGYTTAIIRGNRIRPLDGATPSNIAGGIIAKSVSALTIDNNWIDASTPDNSVQQGSVGKVQVFNNRTLAGDFLPVSIIGSSSHQGELTTDAEIIYAGL